mgnify:CR=1 FL=1
MRTTQPPGKSLILEQFFWLRFFLAPKYMTNCSYKHTFSPPHLIYLLTPTTSTYPHNTFSPHPTIITSRSPISTKPTRYLQQSTRNYHNLHETTTNTNKYIQNYQIFTPISLKLPQYYHNITPNYQILNNITPISHQTTRISPTFPESHTKLPDSQQN